MDNLCAPFAAKAPYGCTAMKESSDHIVMAFPLKVREDTLKGGSLLAPWEQLLPFE